jgi:hypothetical protein
MKPLTALAVLALIFTSQASAKDKRQDAIKNAIDDVRAVQQGAKEKEEDDANAKREAANTQRYWLRYTNRRFDDRAARFLLSPFGVAEAPAPDGVLLPAYHDLADCERDREIREKVDPPDGPISNWTCVPISITFKTYNAGRAVNARQQKHPHHRHQQQPPEQEQEPYLLYENYLRRPTGGNAIRAPHFLTNFSTTAPYTAAPYYTRLRFFGGTTSGITIIRTVRQPEELRFPKSYKGPCCGAGAKAYDEHGREVYCPPCVAWHAGGVPIDKFASILQPELLDKSPPCPIDGRCAIFVPSKYGNFEPVTYWGPPSRRTRHLTVAVGRPASCKQLPTQLEIPMCDGFFGNCKFQYDQSRERPYQMQRLVIEPTQTPGCRYCLIDRHVPPVDPSAPDPPPCQ